MPYWTYILQSEASGRYYCGFSDNPDRRVAEHNNPQYHGSKTTKRFEGPWKLVWKQAHANRSEAMRMEKKIKKLGIARFLDESSHGESGPGPAPLVESRPARD
ncbi:MAG: GIY-YIG nuclease family protein [Candidatus Hydrogenedentes bacterium]|nr:GIY-YIG nuclease family protein [Candidatus Hydrogenedentota bacterium]